MGPLSWLAQLPLLGRVPIGQIPASVTAGAAAAILSTAIVAPGAATEPVLADPVTATAEAATSDDSMSASIERLVEPGPARTDTKTETFFPTTTVPTTTVPTTTVPTTTVPTTTVPTTTVPTTTVPTTTVATTYTATSIGGTIEVIISGNNVQLQSTNPSPGYTIDIRDAGPDKVEVRFTASDAESRIKLRIRQGSLEQEIEEK